MRTRLAIAVPGVLAGIYGLVLLIDQGFDNLRATVIWAAGGVIAHDAILAPLVLLVCLVAARLLPPSALAPAVVGGIVLGTLSVVAVPVLGRFGARSDNSSLLDRDYPTAWLVVAGLTLAGVLLASVLGARGRPATRRGGGEGSRG